MSAVKDQIADSFQKRFNYFGMKKTSVDEVAKELHISKKTIYQHFSTKEEVFYYVVTRGARQYRVSMEKDLEAYASYPKKLERLIQLIFTESRKWLKKNDAFEFKYKYEIAGLAFRDTYTELVADLVQKGIDAGEFSVQPVEMTVRFIRGIITESMNALVAQPELRAENGAIEAILKLLR
jgi:AcrR family transcriptional regulator